MRRPAQGLSVRVSAPVCASAFRGQFESGATWSELAAMFGFTYEQARYFGRKLGLRRTNGDKTDTPARKTIYNRRYVAKYPEKRLAHKRVENALLSGKINRSVCSSCGTGKNVHAHHEDYSKPLDVVWLCHPCHEAEHHNA